MTLPSHAKQLPPWGRHIRFASLLFADMLAFNVLLYQFLKALLFLPTGYSSIVAVVFWFVLFAGWLFYSSRIRLWRKRGKTRDFLLQLLLILLFSGGLYYIAGILPKGPDTDWSWIRPEILKVPLWLRMFVLISPLFTGVFVLLVIFLMFLAQTSPRSLLLRLLPVVGGALLVMLTSFAFSDTITDYRTAYLFMFVSPLFLFCLLIWLRWFVMAFRVIPLTFHMTLILLSYVGLLPVHHIQDMIPGVESRQAYLAQIPGASFLSTSPPINEVPAFMFLRKMLLDEGHLFVMYGPMGMTGLIRIDRADGRMEEVKMQGLIRDLLLTEDGKDLMGVNWQNGDVLWIATDSLTTSCVADIGQYQLYTPWNLLVRGEKLYISNVTYPVVAELARSKNQDGCGLTLSKKIDFYQAGYTQATDGAFGLYLDAERNRLYVLVGMLEGRYVVGLVELDLEDFAILRDVRVPAGVTVFHVPGTDRLLLPSYYYNEIYDVSLEKMELVRTLQAPANIFSLAYDPKRGILYAVSRSAGVLTAIDFGSGRKVKEVAVGAKSEPLLFDAAADRLYVGSRLGIMTVDLGKFFAKNPE